MDDRPCDLQATHAAGTADALTGPAVCDVAGTALEAELASTSRKFASRLIRALGPPLLAFFLARAFLIAVAALHGVNAFASRPWLHHDGRIYLGIAEHGYQIHPIATDGKSPQPR